MASTSQTTSTGGALNEWKYPSYLLAELDGGFVHPNDDPDGLFDWVFDPNLKGTYFTQHIDSGLCEFWIGADEAKKTERAFRNGFLEAVLEIVDKFPSNLSPRSTYAWLDRKIEAAKDIRKRQWRATEVAAPCHGCPEYAGKVLFSIGHWIDGARLRGIHHAWVFVQQDWEHLDGTPYHRTYLPGYCPNLESLRTLRKLALPKWPVAVKAWQATPDDRWPPPRPVGRRAGTQNLAASDPE